MCTGGRAKRERPAAGANDSSDPGREKQCAATRIRELQDGMELERSMQSPHGAGWPVGIKSRAMVRTVTRACLVGSVIIFACGVPPMAGCDRAASRSVSPSVEVDPDQCAKRLRSSRPNIVLVTICTGRFWNMGIGGYKRDTTPFIDELARGGVLFDNAVSSSSWTKPTTASILTGMTPNVHGMTDYYEYSDIRRRGFSPKRVLADDIITIAECLKAAGYATFVRNNNIHASHFFNMTQGFDDAPPIYRTHQTPAMLRDLGVFLEGLPGDKPFFAFILTRDAHVPYVPAYEYYRKFCRSKTPYPRDGFERYAVMMKQRLNEMSKRRMPFTDQQKRDYMDLYDARLNQLDAALARLPDVLKRAGRLENTVIVLTADHGERFFGAHGALGHAGGFMGEALTHVPLVFSGPHIPAGRVVHQQVRSIDIYPTLAELAGATAPPVVEGRSLLPRLCGDTSQPKRSAFMSYRGRDHAVRMDGYKFHLFADGHSELYNIKDDPNELVELSEKKPDVADRLADELKRWMDLEARLREQVARGEMRDLSPEVIKQLRALGYID